MNPQQPTNNPGQNYQPPPNRPPLDVGGHPEVQIPGNIYPTVPEPLKPAGTGANGGGPNYGKERFRDGWRSIISTALLFLLAPIIALSITAFVIQSYQVDGQSMETTLQDN